MAIPSPKAEGASLISDGLHHVSVVAHWVAKDQGVGVSKSEAKRGLGEEEGTANDEEEEVLGKEKGFGEMRRRLSSMPRKD
ncbi:hypothetical protein GW17_00040881 [Ensete ventricosum]|nr:hypothetical protein GW17_00040881 [Ensete ventricosum]